MGIRDGQILGVQQISGVGPVSDRWVLVIMGDGYHTGTDMTQFRADAAALAATLLATPPYSSLTAGINIFRVDVESFDTGVKEPTKCGGSGTPFNTYFEASLCGDGVLRRYLTIKKELALSAAKVHVPQWDQIIVVANSPLYGGGALNGGVATCTRHPQGWQVAMHELGHNLGLADEYEENPGAYPAAWLEPEANIAKNPAALKWGSLVAPGTPIPTQVNAGCSQQGPATPAAGGVYGAFEGAKRYTCNIYRPSATCKMRVITDDFCQVCQDHIRSKLSTFMPHT